MKKASRYRECCRVFKPVTALTHVLRSYIIDFQSQVVLISIVQLILYLLVSYVQTLRTRRSFTNAIYSYTLNIMNLSPFFYPSIPRISRITQHREERRIVSL